MAETQNATIPNNEIWYTSTDGKVVTPTSTTGFGATILTNTYTDGKGVITFDGDVTKIGDSAFRSNGKFMSITMPNSVTSIGAYTFQRCTGLTSVIISNTLADIGEHAFDGCSSLTSITIPNSIKRIQSNALYKCTSLTSVIIEAKTPPTFYSYIFEYSTNVSIYVPSESVEAYKTAENLTNYADLIKAIPESPHKSFLDLSGLQTFWNKLKSYFISSGTGYLKTSGTSEKSIDIDPNQIAKGTQSGASTKLATNGLLLDMIAENVIRSINKR